MQSRTALVVVLILIVCIGTLVVLKPKTTAKASSPTEQSGPIISLDFDDGFESAYQNAIPIINQAGYPVTDYIITHYFTKNGYMTSTEILDLQAKGNEIGAHTQTHPHLTQLTLVQAQQEIAGSKQDLENIGITPTTFAYPYGDHNQAIENLVEQAGFAGARITEPGFNMATTDPYALWYFGVIYNTNIKSIEKAIDQVAANKKWLIIVFHRVGDGIPTTVNRDDTSAALVQEVVDYIKSKNIPVVTNAEGLKIMKNIGT